MLQYIQPRSVISHVALEKLLSEELFYEPLKCYIDEFATPFTPSRRWQQLFTKELLLIITLKLVDSDVDSTSATVQYHDNLVSDELLLDHFLAVFPALDGSTLRLQTEEKVAAHLLLDYLGCLASIAHEEFVLLAPQGRHCQHPSDSGLHNFANLFL